MAGKFEVYEGADHRFHFLLKSRNGEVVGQSQGDGYGTRSSAHKGAERAQNAAREATIVDGDA